MPRDTMELGPARPAGRAALELWGGPECTVNRVGDDWHDQTIATGHQQRLGDLERFASLGLASLRYPVLWERVSPDRPDEGDWRWSDERLADIRRLGLNPIVGLIHHGSGPRYTSLTDPGFAEGLAAHARATAERYPWVRDWTPVNEPLTTARFSCLYGHWYPHARDERLFWTALLNQIDATRLSVRAIRAVNPQARLIQTEDLGFTWSTPQLAHQAAFENLRRWATWDLLTGRITPDHHLWAEMARFGLADRLRAIAEDPCPPDVIGVNHYLTSERLLDHRARRYPPHLRGPEGYVDVEAVRALGPPPHGWTGVLRHAWDRYGLPIAVTEAHNGCTRDEQMRWFHEAWRACETLRDDGVDIRAVTAWALLGSHDWTSLLTRREGRYECGVFDVRSGGPRETAMAPMLRALASGRQPASPLLSGRGWWRRPIRRLHPSVGRAASEEGGSSDPPPLRLLGADNPLARVAADVCGHRDLPIRRLGTDRGPEPWATLQVGEGRLVLWRPTDASSLTVLAPEAFSPEHRDSPLHRAAAALLAGRPVFAADIPVAPVFAPDAVDLALDLFIDGESGLWTLEREVIEESDLFRELARHLGADPSLVMSVSATDARRFAWSACAVAPSATATLPSPSLETALHRFAARMRTLDAAPAHCDLRGETVAAETH